MNDEQIAVELRRWAADNPDLAPLLERAAEAIEGRASLITTEPTITEPRTYFSDESLAAFAAVWATVSSRNQS